MDFNIFNVILSDLGGNTDNELLPFLPFDHLVRDIHIINARLFFVK